MVRHVTTYQTISGTGSRALALKPRDHQINIFMKLKAELHKRNPSQVISGGAEGFDSALAAAAFALGIPFTLALPSPSYGEYYWKHHSVTNKDRYDVFQRHLDRASEVVYVCDHHSYGKANFIRNEWMVDRADFFFVYDRTSRGTSHCVKLLEAKGIDFYELTTGDHFK